MGIPNSTISNSKVAKQIKSALGDDILYAFPDEPFYSLDHVKPYNLDHPTLPFCVTYPKTKEQVAKLVKIAADNGLRVQGKSGGHSYCNFSSPDGGMIIDLKHFKHFSIDPKTFVCEVGAGTLLGELDKKLSGPEKLHSGADRAIAHGVCPQVGIGGHATIGGLGPSSRKFGACLDHILGVEMITADGKIVNASEEENSDLFWAIRGAGASFGVITKFTMRTNPSPENIVEYRYSFTSGTWADMASVFKRWQSFIAETDLTDNFASEAVITALGLVISGTFFGTQEEFDKLALRPDWPLKDTGKQTIVFKDWLGSLMHWAEKVALVLGGGIPARAYTKTLTFGKGKDKIPDEIVDKMFRYIEKAEKDTLIWFIIFDLAGGEINRIDPEGTATAYAHRDALFYLQAYAVSQFPTPVSSTTKAFLKGLTDLLVHEMTVDDGHYTDYGAYPGYVDLEMKDAQKAYWRGNLPKLEELKAKRDAKDVFHNPQSVRPGGKEVPYTLPAWADVRGKLPWWSKVFR